MPAVASIESLTLPACGPSPACVRQRGLSLLGLLVAGLVAAAVAIMVVRMTPALLEYQSVVKAARLAAASGTEAEARATFERVAGVEGITSLRAADLRIERRVVANTEGLSVAFEYRRDFPVAGPLALSLKFSGQEP